ncbi:MAG: hypothetical protein PXX77_09060 [Gallionella sp.]|nr:hypothetical protein [Gallionella sp.]
MFSRSICILCLAIPHFALAETAGLRVGAGVFTLAKDGADFQVALRLPRSPYQIGYRYVRWTDVFHDPFTGRALTETTQSMEGPFLNYLFQPEAARSFYAGISLLNWSRTEQALLITTPSGSASTTDLYFGGGYTGSIGDFGYFNLGMYLSPTAKLNTQTAVSSEESSGGFDTQIQIGLAF